MRRAGWALVVFALAVAIAVVMWRVSRPASGEPSPAESHLPVPNASGLPKLRHVYLLILENKGPDQIDDADEAPYYASLLRANASTTDYHAVARPSQPNYLALFSGSTHGIDDDKLHDLDTPTIADQLEKVGRRWHVYAENVPQACYTGDTASDGRDGAGTYARKHEPAINFDAIRHDPARCARISDFSSFRAGEADFSLIIPNLCHDMHDCSVAEGDRFLRDWLPRLIDGADWTDRDLLVITFDEGAGRDQQNEVLTLFAGSVAKPGFRSPNRYDHYSLLRTFEDVWGLACIANSCSAAAMSDMFKSPATP
jgi:hypothetical protein